MVCDLCRGNRKGRDQRTEAVGSLDYILRMLADMMGQRNALRRHLDQDLPPVMETITRSMQPILSTSMGNQDEGLREAEAACRCTESWIGYGLGGE